MLFFRALPISTHMRTSHSFGQATSANVAKKYLTQPSNPVRLTIGALKTQPSCFHTKVRPLLSGRLLSDHPPLSGHSSKVPIYFSVFHTSTQRPPMLTSRGHHFADASVLFICFF